MTALLFAPRDPRCPECKDNGKCAECNGTGINVHINETEPKCRNCSGTGVCPMCEGRYSDLTGTPANLGLND